MSAYGLARKGLAGAYQIRKRIGASLDEPLAPIDAALQLNVHVSILAVPSMEGMWCREKRAIVLNSLRPPGRRAFTCAHELAHWHYDHGTIVDELVSERSSHENRPEERAANLLAGCLLMPPYGVPRAIKDREWEADLLTPVQAYTLASVFGVSYGAFVNHIRYALELIGHTSYTRLKDVAPKAIRRTLCPEVETSNMTVIDSFWRARTVDLEVGDALVCSNPQALPSKYFVRASNNCAIAKEPGVLEISNQSDLNSLLIRIGQPGFTGYGQYRYPRNNNVYGTASSAN